MWAIQLRQWWQLLLMGKFCAEVICLQDHRLWNLKIHYLYLTCWCLPASAGHLTWVTSLYVELTLPLKQNERVEQIKARRSSFFLLWVPQQICAAKEPWGFSANYPYIHDPNTPAQVPSSEVKSSVSTSTHWEELAWDIMLNKSSSWFQTWWALYDSPWRHSLLWFRCALNEPHKGTCFDI